MIIEDPIVHDHLPEGHLRASLVADVTAGLRGRPRTLPPKWFYDERGSQLFDRITELPEYYPTRAERELLTRRAAEIVERSGARTLELHLGKIPAGPHRLVAFLGGTVGNFDPVERRELLGELVAGFGEGDHLLLGTDLVKDPARLVAAYDDAAGVTAEFNKNVLRVLARQLDAEGDPDGFDHVAVWNDVDEWIEMRLRARSDQVIRIPQLDLEVEFAEGEDLRTEISAKFRLDRLGDELGSLGLELVEVWTDTAGDYALSLSRPA